MVQLDQTEILESFPPAEQLAPPEPPTVEELLAQNDQLPDARVVTGAIETKWRGLSLVHDRMDIDKDLYELKQFVPDTEDSVAPEDAYTTNAPRVLAEKIISFIAATETVVRTVSDQAQEQQEDHNDTAEQLGVGMLNNANRRRRRAGNATIEESLAWFAVVRGRWAAARAVLRKRENGETYDDIIPLDPRFLIVEPGDEEPVWAAYKMRKKLQAIRDEYPDFQFDDLSQAVNINDDEALDVWEYYTRKPNPLHDPFSQDPFARHPWVYLAGTIIDDKWARDLHNLWMFNFPVVLAPVTSQPILTPSDGEDDQEEDASFGESVFAELRNIWRMLNRHASYLQDLTAKASDPPIDVISVDGTFALDEGASEKGAQRELSTAAQQEIKIAETADVQRAAAFFLKIIQTDLVAGGLPPQAFGIVDKPLSAVALRQLGNNLEHRILPRLRAVAACIEGCLENLIGQYETGAFQPITVSGRRFDNQQFANRVIEPQDIQGHDPVLVKMDLALPEDQSTLWAIAAQSQTVTPSGEPIVSLEWMREKILKVESSKLISRQNREDAGKVQDPLAMAAEQVQAYIKDGDMSNASIWYDRLQVLNMQRQVEAGMMQLQMKQIADQIGLPLQPPPLDIQGLQSTVGQGPTVAGGALTNQSAGANNQARNPANGAPGVAEVRGQGNTPSPDASGGAASRQRDTGLVARDGNPIFANEGGI